MDRFLNIATILYLGRIIEILHKPQLVKWSLYAKLPIYLAH